MNNFLFIIAKQFRNLPRIIFKNNLCRNWQLRIYELLSRFLKHVERTKMMLFVIDIQGFQLNQNSAFRTAFENVVLLNRELELYRSDLVDKPCLCLVNKMDTDGAEEKLVELKDLLTVRSGLPNVQ